MGNLTVSLYIRKPKPSGKWGFDRIPEKKIAKLKPLEEGEGMYYLSWYEGRSKKYLSVGRSPDEARTAYANRLNGEIIPRRIPGLNGSGAPKRRTIDTAVSEYLEEVRLSKKPKTLAAYTVALGYFQESCSKLYMDEIERIDLLKFSAFLKEEKEQSPRSCWNKFSNVMSFLKNQGIRGLMKKNDWPKFVEEEPEVYDKAELDKLFAVCDAEERLWFSFFLMTGMREQEVMYSTWTDINFAQATITVRFKPEYGFSPKNYKGREIPIPAKLVQELKTRKAKASKTCGLIFPTSGCKPKMNFLDDLKAAAKRAGLNADDFFLHKFRATFATWSLWAGVDLRTVQQWLGHSDMESTMRYLKPARNQRVRDKVNEIFA